MLYQNINGPRCSFCLLMIDSWPTFSISLLHGEEISVWRSASMQRTILGIFDYRLEKKWIFSSWLYTSFWKDFGSFKWVIWTKSSFLHLFKYFIILIFGVAVVLASLFHLYFSFIFRVIFLLTMIFFSFFSCGAKNKWIVVSEQGCWY